MTEEERWMLVALELYRKVYSSSAIADMYTVEIRGNTVDGFFLVVVSTSNENRTPEVTTLEHFKNPTEALEFFEKELGIEQI